jgi:hypothetical protein
MVGQKCKNNIRGRTLQDEIIFYSWKYFSGFGIEPGTNKTGIHLLLVQKVLGSPWLLSS